MAIILRQHFFDALLQVFGYMSASRSKILSITARGACAYDQYICIHIPSD